MKSQLNTSKSKGIRRRREESPKKDIEERKTIDPDEEQSFSNWLRTGEGVELMKFFVICNSFIVFITMAWPYVREALLSYSNADKPITLDFSTILLRSVAFLVVMMWYSMKLWSVIDEYFSYQFRNYLDTEYKKNKFVNPYLIDQISQEREDNDVCPAL